MSEKKEWETELEQVDFEHAGFKCQIKRNGSMGHLCGYVAILESHPCHGKDLTWDDDFDLSVHGGITFSDHSPVRGEGWLIGFDCAHSGDLIPRSFSPAFMSGGTYRNLAYVRKETERLADQLADVKRKDGKP